MRKRKSIEEICASAATDQLSSDEYQQMAKHVEHCPSCRSAQEEFSLFLQQLPVDECGGENDALLRHVEKGGLRQRFLDRARDEGIRFSGDTQNRHGNRGWGFPRLMPAYRWAAAGVILATMMMTADYIASRRSHKQPPEAVSQSQHKREVAAHQSWPRRRTPRSG